MNSHRPFLRLCLALTADGKIATAGRQVHQFGSPLDQARLQALRAQADAILCGARTLEHDAANLTLGADRLTRLRRRPGPRKEPLRVVVSGRASLSPDAPIFQTPGPPILLLTTAAAPACQLERLRPLVSGLFASQKPAIDWPKALEWLRRNWRVRHLLCEGGSQLNSSLLAANLVDEIYLTLCPFLFGGQHAPTLADGLVAEHLRKAPRFKLLSARRFGEEIFLVYRRMPTLKKVVHRPT